MSNVLTFDEASHTYRYGGQVRPSVTQVLSKLHDFGGVPKEVLEAAQERGTAVHLLTQYHDEGDLDPASVGEYGGYLDGWLAFLEVHKPKWKHIELQGYSERYGFAGTMDRAGYIGLTPWIVDVKTSLQPHRVWGMQTSAYRELAAEHTGDARWRMARRGTVQLRRDGTFKLLPWDDPADWPAFLSLITLTNWINQT